MLSNMQIAMCFSVERERLRERERQVRQQMSSQAVEREDALPSVPVSGAPLFSLPQRVSSTHNFWATKVVFHSDDVQDGFCG